MKNIIVIGPPRSGKSTICNMLYHKYGYSVFETDSLISSFGKVFPELGIKNGYEPKIDIKFRKFAIELLKYIFLSNKHGGVVTTIPTAHILPETMFEFEKARPDNEKKYLVIGIGTCETTAQKMLEEIRKNDKEGIDWTSKLADEELLKNCEHFIFLSKHIKKECQKYNYKFFDVSFDREKCQNEIIEYIIKNQQL